MKYHNKSNQKHIDPYYGRLVNAVREFHPEKYVYFLKKIKELYKDNIFILERGDIETYLGMREK